MCIYFGDRSDLTYKSQEHVIPAGLGCHTMLDKGVVSDQANAYFSPIERRVLQQSFVQLPRIIKGPGKRGSLSPSKATTSDVSVMTHDGEKCLGYMKGTAPFIPGQFSITMDNECITGLTYHQGDTSAIEAAEAQNSARKLQEEIRKWSGKYTFVDMDTEKIFITYFKDKVYIAAKVQPSESQISAVMELFSRDIDMENSSYKVLSGAPSITLEVKHSYIDAAKIAAKTAVNTLAYIMGAEAVIHSEDLKDIIMMIFSDDDSILSRVASVDAGYLKGTFHIKEDMQACLLCREGMKLCAYVFLYDYGYYVELSHNSTLDVGIINGIVCDWKNAKDYEYHAYLTDLGILADIP